MMLDDLIGQDFEEETQALNSPDPVEEEELLYQLKRVEDAIRKVKALRKKKFKKISLDEKFREIRHEHGTSNLEKLRELWKQIQTRRGYDV